MQEKATTTTIQAQYYIATVFPPYCWGNLGEWWGVWKIGKRSLFNVSRLSDLCKETKISDLVVKTPNFHVGSNF